MSCKAQINGMTNKIMKWGAADQGDVGTERALFDKDVKKIVRKEALFFRLE